ncbi:MAG: hypothetical protein PHT25_09780 [Bacteroidales bacterium]|nr:hypothetical protein [Bacteroidales bacterium]
MKIDRKVYDRFRAYAEQVGQTYTTALERIIIEYIEAKEQIGVLNKGRNIKVDKAFQDALKEKEKQNLK